MVCISYNSPTLSFLFQFSSPLSCILVCLNLVFTLLLVLSLILVQLQFPNSSMFATMSVLSQSLLSWHNRLGHPFQSRLQLLMYLFLIQIYLFVLFVPLQSKRDLLFLMKTIFVLFLISSSVTFWDHFMYLLWMVLDIS